MPTWKKSFFVAGFAGLFLGVLLPAIGLAGLSFQSQPALRVGLSLPEDVAVAEDGTVYVVDGDNDQVLLFDAGGRSVGAIAIEKPTAVAAGGNGHLYVGSNSDLSVKVFDASHAIVDFLGKGAGEFKLPRNIAIDQDSGEVYVVDQLDQSIKVYSTTGDLLFKIDDSPNLPQDVAVGGGEIHVIDQPLLTDQNGGKIRGAKIKTYDMSGRLIRSFGTYGTNDGELIRPKGISAGSAGILYVSDSFHGVVLVFASSGAYLGSIYELGNPMIAPLGIAVSSDNRLYAASAFTKSVNVFDILTASATSGRSKSPLQAAIAGDLVASAIR